MALKTAVCSFLIILMLAGVISGFAVVHAQSPTPSFTVRVIDDSYIIPYKNVTSTDPYTGKTSWLIEGGGHVENQKIVVTIKNPTYTPVTLPDGNATELRYSIRTKGHFQDWQPDQNYTSPHYSYAVKTSNSTDTVVTYYLQGEPGWETLLPNGGQVDVEVQAIVGYSYFVTGSFGPFVPITTSEVFVPLAQADWSPAQTVTVPKELKNPLPDWWTGPTPAPEPTAVPDNNVPIEIPLPLANPIVTSTPDAVGNPVTDPSGSNDNTTASPQDWFGITVFAALALVVAWLAVYLVLSRRKTKNLEAK